MELLAIMFLFILSKLKIDSLGLDLLVIRVYIHIIINKLSSHPFYFFEFRFICYKYINSMSEVEENCMEKRCGHMLHITVCLLVHKHFEESKKNA